MPWSVSAEGGGNPLLTSEQEKMDKGLHGPCPYIHVPPITADCLWATAFAPHTFAPAKNVKPYHTGIDLSCLRSPPPDVSAPAGRTASPASHPGFLEDTAATTSGQASAAHADPRQRGYGGHCPPASKERQPCMGAGACIEVGRRAKDLRRSPQGRHRFDVPAVQQAWRNMHHRGILRTYSYLYCILVYIDLYIYTYISYTYTYRYTYIHAYIDT